MGTCGYLRGANRKRALRKCDERWGPQDKALWGGGKNPKQRLQHMQRHWGGKCQAYVNSRKDQGISMGKKVKERLKRLWRPRFCAMSRTWFMDILLRPPLMTLKISLDPFFCYYLQMFESHFLHHVAEIISQNGKNPRWIFCLVFTCDCL